jgi:hypothetical protein
VDHRSGQRTAYGVPFQHHKSFGFQSKSEMNKTAQYSKKPFKDKNQIQISRLGSKTLEIMAFLLQTGPEIRS